MRLNQAVSRERDVKARATTRLFEANTQIQKKDLLGGFSKVYHPRKEDGEVFQPETKQVQLRAEDCIQNFAEALAEMMDAAMTRDAGNCVAKANVVVDGEVLLKDVPAVSLIWLEKRLVEVRDFISNLPKLSEAEIWNWDPGLGLYTTPPEITQKTAKIQEHVVVVQATDKFPAQVALVTKDVIIGDWTVVKRSSALQPDRIKALQKRVDTLMDAVKMARQEANTMEITEVSVGRKVLSYLFPPIK